MEDSVTLHDPRLEARAAATAYAQAHALLEADPQISAEDLVERLRQRADDLAAHLDAGDIEVPAPRPAADRDPNRPGLGQAAAEARERVTDPASSPTSPGGDETRLG